MNEFYFSILMLTAFFVVIVAARYGKVALQCAAIVIALTTTVIAGKIIPFFGISASAGTATFTALFLCIDLIAECYGKREALRTVGFTFVANIVFLGLGLIAVQTTEAEKTATGGALSSIFAWIPRLLAGGLIAFLISQVCDVLLFMAVKRFTKGRHLWLRASGSTVISQAVDTIIVWHIAFYGIIENLWSVILVAYLTKLAAAALEAPFCYLGRAVNTEYQRARPGSVEEVQATHP